MTENQEKEKVQTKLYLGLSNQGATCYMNSLLQSLFMTQGFRQKLFEWKYDPNIHNNKEDCIPFQLKYIDTKPLINSFGWQANEMFQQHDVQEFCKVLFDAIEQSCSNKETQFIRDLYEGVTENFIQCKQCNYESIKMDNFQDLQLIINNQFEQVLNDSIEKCFKYYVKSVHLEADNQYFCEKCSKKVDAIKGVRFKQLPQILMLQLNRFDIDYTTFQRKKICNRVYFPFVLNMNEFLKKYEEIQVQESPPFQDEDKQDTNPTIQTQNTQNKQGILKKKDVISNIDTSTADDFCPLFDDTTFDASQKKPTSPQKKQIKFKEVLHPALISRADEAYELETADNSVYWGTDVRMTTKQPQKLEIILEDKENEEKNEQIHKENEQQNDEIKKQIEIDLKNNGPYVYELYVVNVHSGGAFGGHYYSYIKSFENNCWYNFNDSMVNIISPKEIQTVFGQLNCERLTSNTSAYMLMYKLVDSKESSNPPTIPKEVQEMIEEEEKNEKQEVMKNQKHFEEKQKTVSLIIYCENKCHTFVFDKYLNNLQDVKLKVFEHFKISSSFEDFRIRLYLAYDKSLRDTFTEEQEKLPLCQINSLIDYQDLIVEFKEPGQLFEEYDDQKITIFIYSWEENIVNINDLKPIKVYVKYNQKISSLINLIKDKLNIEEDILLIKRNQGHFIEDQCFILNSFQERTVNEQRIQNNSSLYVERHIQSNENPHWNEEFIKDSCKCLIKFNDPATNRQGEPPDYQYEIQIDNRCTLKDAKDMISQKLKIHSDSFIIKKTNAFGPEYKDLTKKMNTQGIQNRGTIYLQYGVPCRENVYLIKYFFGALSTEDYPGLQFDYEQIFEMQTDSMQSVIDLKNLIIKEIKEQKNIDIPSYKHMRVREKNSNNLGSILRNCYKLSEYKFYDKKSLCISILDKEEDIDRDDALIYVKEWNPLSCELSKAVELFVKSDSICSELLIQIGSIYNHIPLENIEIMKVNSVSKFNIDQLILETEWKNINDNFNINQSPWYSSSDGNLFVIRNKLFAQSENIYYEKFQVADGSGNKNQNSNNFSVINKPKYQVQEKALKINIKKKEVVIADQSKNEKEEETKNDQNLQQNNNQENNQCDLKQQQQKEVKEETKEEVKVEIKEEKASPQKQIQTYPRQVQDQDFNDDDEILQQILYETYKNQQK